MSDQHRRAGDNAPGATPTTGPPPDRATIESPVLATMTQVLDQLPAPSAVTDENSIIVGWNPAAEALFGWSPDEIIGRRIEALAMTLGDDGAAVPVALPGDRVATFSRRDGTSFRAIWCAGPLQDPGGRNAGAITTWVDVTAVEEQLVLDAVLTDAADEIERAHHLASADQLVEHERQLRARLEFVTRLDGAVLGANDYRKLMREVAARAVPRLGDWCIVHFLPEPGVPPEVEVAHVDPAKTRWVRELQQRFPFQPTATRGVAAVLRTGRMEFIRDIDDAVIDAAIEAAGPQDADELRRIARDLGLKSSIIVPLRTKRGVVGALQFLSAESGRRYENDDVTLAQAVAGRLADALDNAWHMQQHHAIATTLQAALLPPRLPVVEGVDVAVRYWAAGAADVGGDFYDLFRLSDHRWAIVIGDVCGTGPNAAAVTAIARHTLRAAVRHGVDHAGALQWVNQALHLGDRDLFCTLVYANLEQGDRGEWSFSSIAGGHPLPLLVRADGTAQLIGEPGTLLGVLPAIEATPAGVELRPGDTIVLYTDGVTDVAPPNDLSTDALLTMVQKSAARHDTAQAIAEDLRAEIEALLPIPERNDDVALVVLHVPSDQRE